MWENHKFVVRLGLTLLAVLVLGGQVSAIDRIITLEDAIRIGLRNNYDIQIARNSARLAENDKARGLAGFLPTLDASGNYSYLDASEESNSPSSYGDSETRSQGAQVNLNWTLFDGFRMFASRSRYSALAHLGQQLARQQIENTVVAVSRAYFNLVQQQQLLQAAQDTRDVSNERLEKERLRNELGGASSTDLLNAQVSYNNDQARLLERRLQLEIARQDLNLLLGREPGEPVTVSSEITVPPLILTYEDLLTRALDNNAELRAAEAGRRAADKGIASARATFLPRLSLNAGYSYSDRTVMPEAAGVLTTEATQASVGLVLSMNLFNGGLDRIDWQNARIEANNSLLRLRDTRQRVIGDVRRTWDRFQQRLELMDLEEQNVEAARRNLDLMRERLQTGSVTSLEFRDAQTALLGAQTSLIESRYQARITRLELDQLIGAIQID